MQLATIEARAGTEGFQSSPVPEDGCNRGDITVADADAIVSILTRPGGRVQLAAHARELCRERVSILTRPGGRVQRRTTALNSTQLSSFSAKQRR